MAVIDYQATHLAVLTQLINTHIIQVPPAWKLTETQVEKILDNAGALWRAHYPDSQATESLVHHIVCAFVDDELRAAAQWFSYDNDEQAHLAWLVGQDTDSTKAVLDKILDDARQTGCRNIQSSRFAFGVGWFSFPVVWKPVIAALEAADFTNDQQWVIMVRHANRLPNANRPDIPDLHLSWETNSIAREWNLIAEVDGVKAGECEAWDIPEFINECLDANYWVTIEWLGVEEDFRRKGLGRFLLNKQLQYQARRGIEQVIVWTETENKAAQKLNESLGFVYSHECHTYRRDLG